MPNPASNTGTGQRKAVPAMVGPQLSPEHYLRVIWHRKWLVLGVFLAVFTATVIVSHRLPDIFNSETLILVDPQKVPDSYVKSTVTGDIRNRLGTLSQQILSATRLQRIIDTLNLYPQERKELAREDVIMKMRKDISVSVVSDFGGSQDLQAFRISYSGRDPRLVSQVANELASLFIDENLKAREQQATDTNNFLQSQLQDARKTLEAQEAKLRDFRMKHIGEMPEQQTATLQVLGQLQSQLQLESEALARAEQQKGVLQAMMSQSAPVVELDDPGGMRSSSEQGGGATSKAAAPKATVLDGLRAELNSLQARGYTDTHPSVRKVKARIADAEKNEPAPAVVAEAPKPPAEPVQGPPVPRPPTVRRSAPVSNNPVLLSQLKAAEDEIAKHRQEQMRLNKAISGYTSKLEAIPVREQQIAELVRDSEVSKAHYSQLLNNQLSAETATQLEIRQKGEKFRVLDSAQPAQRPSSPNRPLLNAGGAIGGLGLGLFLALLTEFLGMSITSPEQITESTGLAVLEVIPIIQTLNDIRRRKKRLIWGAVSGCAITILASGAFLFYHYNS
jgi:succinoglycan biosynthesis transport protein ExoP